MTQQQMTSAPGFSAVNAGSRVLFPIDDHPLGVDDLKTALHMVANPGVEIVFLCMTPSFLVIAGAMGAVYIPMTEEYLAHERAQTEVPKTS